MSIIRLNQIGKNQYEKILDKATQSIEDFIAKSAQDNSLQ